MDSVIREREEWLSDSELSLVDVGTTSSSAQQRLSIATRNHPSRV